MTIELEKKLRKNRYVDRPAMVALERFAKWFTEKKPEFVERCFPDGMTSSDAIQQLEAELRMCNREYKSAVAGK